MDRQGLRMLSVHYWNMGEPQVPAAGYEDCDLHCAPARWSRWAQ